MWASAMCIWRYGQSVWIFLRTKLSRYHGDQGKSTEAATEAAGATATAVFGKKMNTRLRQLALARRLITQPIVEFLAKHCSTSGSAYRA